MKIDRHTLEVIADHLQKTPYDGPVHRIMVDGVPLIVQVKVSIDTYESCARAEIALQTTLQWEERPDRYEGFSGGCMVATVMKKDKHESCLRRDTATSRN